MPLALEQHSPILALLAELRNEIYALVVKSDAWLVPDGKDRKEAKQPALTQTCFKIRSEALPLFYSINRFCICVLYPSRDICASWLRHIGDRNVKHMRKLRFKTYLDAAFDLEILLDSSAIGMPTHLVTTSGVSDSCSSCAYCTAYRQKMVETIMKNTFKKPEHTGRFSMTAEDVLAVEYAIRKIIVRIENHAGWPPIGLYCQDCGALITECDLLEEELEERRPCALRRLVSERVVQCSHVLRDYFTRMKRISRRRDFW